MQRLLHFLRSLFRRRKPSGDEPAREEPVAPITDAISFASPLPAVTGFPILLVGEELAWLKGQATLASRPIVVVEPGVDPLLLLSARPHAAVVAGYADLHRSFALLQSAAAISPATVGIVRTGQKELGQIPSLFPVLPRTDSLEVLDDQLRTRLVAAVWQANPAAAHLLKKMTRLPTLPAIYSQITAALQSPHASVSDIAALVALEPAVSAKLLQLANSPLFSLHGRVTSVQEATQLLGLSRLRSLVLATCLFRQFDPSVCAGFSMAQFEESSLRMANWAASIAREESGDQQLVEMAFTAGLLHKFGTLLLAVNLPDVYQGVLQQARAQGVDVAWAELQTFGVANSEIAGGILASWGLPFPIVNAVGWSAVPSSSEDTAFSPLTAVHTAMAAELVSQTGMQNYDRAYIEKLHFEPRLRHWCEKLARETLPPAL